MKRMLTNGERLARQRVYNARFRKRHPARARASARKSRLKYYRANKKRINEATVNRHKKLARADPIAWGMYQHLKLLLRSEDPAYMARQRAVMRVRTTALADSYLRRCLCKDTFLLSADIPSSLVELKRAQIKLIRIIKQAA